MAYRRSVASCLGLVLAASLSFTEKAIADSTTDPCSDPPSACAASCTKASACNVSLSRNDDGSVRIAVNGTDAPIFCVDSGIVVSWATPDATSKFKAKFNPAHKPFPNAVVSGSSGHPAKVKASLDGEPCYVYSASVCDSSGKCAKNDPRVIVRQP